MGKVKVLFIMLMIAIFMNCKVKSVTNSGGGTGGTVPNSNTAPKAMIGADQTHSEVPPLQVQFDGSGSTDSDGTITSYDWDFGDGSSGAGEIISHTYTKAGDYSVVLTVTDDDGAIATSNVTITIDCDIVHNGDLIVSGREVLEIKDCVYCQHGNIIVKDSARFIVTNAEIKLIQPEFQGYIIRIEAFTSITDTILSSNYSFGIEVTGDGLFTNCIMKDDSRFYTMERGKAVVTNSQLGGIGSQGKSSLTVTNSDVLDLVDVDTIYTDEASFIIPNLHPGFIEDWKTNEIIIVDKKFSNLILKDTTVNRWTVRVSGDDTVVEIRDSEIDWLRVGATRKDNRYWTGGPTFVINSEINWFLCVDFKGESITFTNAHLGMFEISDSDLDINGSLTFIDDRVIWDSATVTRNYDVFVVDEAGAALSNTGFNLYTPDGNLAWTGTSDAQGHVSFSIVFNDSNYQGNWTLEIPTQGVSRSVKFLTDTPIQIQVSN